MKRHNKALESLAVAKEKFYENEIKQHDKIQLLRQKLADANKDMDETNKALDMLRKVRTISCDGVSYSRRPQLNDLYKPSDKMKELQYVTVVGLGIGCAFILKRIL